MVGRIVYLQRCHLSKHDFTSNPYTPLTPRPLKETCSRCMALSAAAWMEMKTKVYVVLRYTNQCCFWNSPRDQVQLNSASADCLSPADNSDSSRERTQEIRRWGEDGCVDNVMLLSVNELEGRNSLLMTLWMTKLFYVSCDQYLVVAATRIWGLAAVPRFTWQ